MQKMTGFIIVLTAVVTSFGFCAVNCRADEQMTITNDGAWCWFQDERAVVYDKKQKMTVASITGKGDVRATSFDFVTGTLKTVVLHEKFVGDDHNVPGILIRDDGHLMAFYTKHHDDNLMRYRVSTKPYDGTSWQLEQTYHANVKDDKFTYANPFQLSGEQGKIYNFWRGIDRSPIYAVSEDNCKTWSDGKKFIYYRKGHWPYVKYTTNHTDTIHFAFTDSHPVQSISSLHHAYYKAGKLYTSDGSFIRNLADCPISPSEATRIYDGVNSPTGRAWVWDIHLDPSGSPIIAYTSHLDSNDHRYRRARWNKKTGRWVDRQIAYAGTRLYAKELYYSGGIAIDPDNVNVVYISSDVNIHDGSPTVSGRYEIYKGQTSDRGDTWTWQPITSNSTEDNLRPIVPANHPGQTFVLWMKGSYKTYTKYNTAIVLRTDAKIPPTTHN
jgi:BNR repeat-containing family member